jgi:hypothetical protein
MARLGTAQLPFCSGSNIVGAAATIRAICIGSPSSLVEALLVRSR